MEEKIEETKELALISKMEEYKEAGKFESAIQLYESEKKKLKDITDAEKKYEDIIIVFAEKQVDSAVKNEKYADAIKKCLPYVDIIDKEDSVSKKLMECEQSYREEICETAKDTYKEKGASDAIKIINEGLSILEDDEILIAEKKKYQDAEPIN